MTVFNISFRQGGMCVPQLSGRGCDCRGGQLLGQRAQEEAAHLPHSRMQQDLRQNLAPQSTLAVACGGEALCLHLDVLHQKIYPLWWASGNAFFAAHTTRIFYIYIFFLYFWSYFLHRQREFLYFCYFFEVIFAHTKRNFLFFVIFLKLFFAETTRNFCTLLQIKLSWISCLYSFTLFTRHVKYSVLICVFVLV